MKQLSGGHIAVLSSTMFDAVAEDADVVDVEISKDISGGLKLYVNVNGMTVLRIGKIKQEIEVTRD